VIEAAAPQPVRLEDGLQQLVDEALAANLELRASSMTVQQRLAALAQARARYLPAIDLAARYSIADGGRTIDIPVGDLVNPIYETLEQLLDAQGQPRPFPRVRNQSIDLLRNPEQETKLRDAHLGAIRAPMLFLQGTRDEFARLDLLKATVERLGPLAELALFEDADHSFKTKRGAQATSKQTEAAAFKRLGEWLDQRA
jgi:pimeloyl-ACP methyl ester carboxylesterase